MILKTSILFAVAMLATAASPRAHGAVCEAHNASTLNVSASLTPLPSGGALSNVHAYRFTPARTIFPAAGWVFSASPNRDDYMRLEIWADKGGVPSVRLLQGAMAAPRSSTPTWLGSNFDRIAQLRGGDAYWFVWVEAGDSIVPEEPGGTQYTRMTQDSSGAWIPAGSGAIKFQLFCGDTIEGAHVLRAGNPCSTSLDTQPFAWTNEEPTVGNASFAIEGVHFPPSANAWLLVGFGQSFLPVRLDLAIGAPFACTLYSNPAASIPGATGAAEIGALPASARPSAYGHVRFPVPIPPDATLSGLFVTMQILAIDSGASAATPIVLSNGLHVTVP